MIRVDTSKCLGCGTCAERCSHGALYLSLAGHAGVVWSLCPAGCRECLSFCAQGALSFVPSARPAPRGHSVHPSNVALS